MPPLTMKIKYQRILLLDFDLEYSREWGGGDLQQQKYYKQEGNNQTFTISLQTIFYESYVFYGFESFLTCLKTKSFCI